MGHVIPWTDDSVEHTTDMHDAHNYLNVLVSPGPQGLFPIEAVDTSFTLSRRGTHSHRDREYFQPTTFVLSLRILLCFSSIASAWRPS